SAPARGQMGTRRDGVPAHRRAALGRPGRPPLYAPERLNAKELGKFLGVSGLTVRRWAERGLLPAPLRLGKRFILFSTAAVREHLTACISAAPVRRNTAQGKDAANGDLPPARRRRRPRQQQAQASG